MEREPDPIDAAADEADMRTASCIRAAMLTPDERKRMEEKMRAFEESQNK